MALHRGAKPLSARSINLQSHAFLQTYGAILPTSLTYIDLSARGYSPWRPAAVIGTTRSGSLDTQPLAESAPFGFHGSSVPPRLLVKKDSPVSWGVLPDFSLPSRVNPSSGAIEPQFGGFLRPPPRARQRTPSFAPPLEDAPPRAPLSEGCNRHLLPRPHPLRGKEISSQGHGRRPKGRFSVTASWVPLLPRCSHSSASPPRCQDSSAEPRTPRGRNTRSTLLAPEF